MTATKRPTFYPHSLIGWREHVRLPKLGIGPIIAKIDTGARSAALHADEIEVRHGRVRFVIIIDGHRHSYHAPLAGQKRIKSSSGHSELRPVVETVLELGQHLFTTAITLTDRTDMGVPMLLGRATIKGRFVVHPGRSFLLRRKVK